MILALIYQKCWNNEKTKKVSFFVHYQVKKGFDFKPTRWAVSHSNALKSEIKSGQRQKSLNPIGHIKGICCGW